MSCRALNSKPLPKTQSRHEAIMAPDVATAYPYHCGGGALRVSPHSKASSLLVWKCSWFGRRRGKLTADDQALFGFTSRHGGDQQPPKIQLRRWGVPLCPTPSSACMS
jgi:hypothetical protein